MQPATSLEPVRVLRLKITVVDELFPITTRHDGEGLKQSFTEILDCHQQVYCTAKILHRNICLQNLRIASDRADGDSVHYYGVLNDFDLAIDMPQNHMGHLSTHRTGTKPFVAIDLLLKPAAKQLYHHDLESFFWVLFWVVSRYHLGAQPRNGANVRPLDSWLCLPKERLGERKAGMLHPDRFSVEPTELYTVLRVTVENLAFQLCRGAVAKCFNMLHKKRGTQNPVPYDDETLGNKVTHERFREILDA